MRPFASQPSLFADPTAPLPGLRYETDFLSADEEQRLIEHIIRLPLEEMRYKSYTARRRIVSFGGRYDFDRNKLQESPPPPDWLEPLRVRVAQWLGVQPSAFTQILVAEYRPGTPLGWHRDVPDFEEVVGVSLHSDALMKFRPYPASRTEKPPRRASAVLKLALQARSVYLLSGEARWEWQHSVAPTPALRYSVTFRTAAVPRKRQPVD